MGIFSRIFGSKPKEKKKSFRWRCDCSWCGGKNTMLCGDYDNECEECGYMYEIATGNTVQEGNTKQ
jgi:hypothetical protein